MPRYTYQFNTSSSNRIELAIKEGAVIVGSAFISTVNAEPIFESYSVISTCQNRGLSYALTYLMMLRSQDSGAIKVHVNNAHWPLNLGLRKLGFEEVKTRCDPTFKPKIIGAPGRGEINTGDYSCGDLRSAMTRCKSIMVKRGLIADGFRELADVKK